MLVCDALVLAWSRIFSIGYQFVVINYYSNFCVSRTSLLLIDIYKFLISALSYFRKNLMTKLIWCYGYTFF